MILKGPLLVFAFFRRSSQNHSTNHRNSETHSAPGSPKFERKFPSVAATSQNFQVLSENTVLQQQYESAKPYHQHHYQQQPQQQHHSQQQQQQCATATTILAHQQSTQPEESNGHER